MLHEPSTCLLAVQLLPLPSLLHTLSLSHVPCLSHTHTLCLPNALCLPCLCLLQHNRRHAADVLRTLHVLLVRGGLAPGYADSDTMVACYLAAVSTA